MSGMSFEDALALVDDDLPDGAFFAMADELAGFTHDGLERETEVIIDEVDPENASIIRTSSKGLHGTTKQWRCQICAKRFRLIHGARDHFRDMHSEARPRVVSSSEKLIAVDLLAALTELDAALDDGLCNIGTPGFDEHRLDRAQQAAKFAIAKAEGRQP